MISWSMAQPGLSLWAREFGARLLATETYQNANRGRMNTRSVALVENGYLVDRYDGREWLSGYASDPE
jgi:hypothetical protein